MIFAQIVNGNVVNTIIVASEDDIPLFQVDLSTGIPYDYVIRLDYLYPRPGIGWSFDGIQFYAPPPPPDPPDDGGGP